MFHDIVLARYIKHFWTLNLLISLGFHLYFRADFPGTSTPAPPPPPPPPPPRFLKNILAQSGFDCESALLLLNEDKIKKNELEVAANLESYRNLFKKTVYEKNQNADGEFHFLIGHRELLLSIPESLQQKNARKKK